MLWKPGSAAPQPEHPPGEISQESFGGEQVLLRKEIVPLSLGAGRKLLAVRKSPVTTEPRAQLLFLHGFGQNRYSFHLPGHSLTAWLVSQGFITWNLDLRGHGRSFSHSPMPRHIDDYVEDYERVVPAVAASAPYPLFVLGHSLGGGIIVAGIQETRRYLRGAVLLAGVYGFGGRQPLFRWAGALLNRLSLLPLDTPLPISFIGDLLSQAPALLNRPWLQPVPFHLWYPGSFPDHLIGFRLRHGFDRTSYGVLKHLTLWAKEQAMLTWDRRRDYREAWRRYSTLPILVLAGNRDYLLPPSDAKPAYTDSPALDKTFKVFSEAEGGSPWGHVDLVQGKRAPLYVWTYLRDWLLDHL